MRFFDLRGFLIGGAIVCTFIAVYGAKLLYDEWPSFRFNTALERTVSCADAENPATCARPSIERMLDIKSGGDIMNTLSVRLTPLQCHHTGHVVGQQLFHKSGDIESAISACNRTCDSACIHGIIGEAFLTEVGYDDPDFDLAHLSPEDIRGVGRRLCESLQACHGVGHALFQIYQEFAPAFSICREITSEQSVHYCYQGAAMEYADILSSRNLRDVPGVEYPSVEDLDSLCDFPSYEERRSCFRYFPRVATATLVENGFSLDQAKMRVREMCRSFPLEKDRFMCVIGIGVYSSYALLKDPRAAVQICQEFPDALDQMACHLGQISSATQDRQSEVTAYCAAVPETSLQASCYQALFYFLNQLGTSMKEAAKLCDGDEMCLNEVGNYKESPLERALKSFGR